MTFEQYLRQNFDGKNVKILGIHNVSFNCLFLQIITIIIF